MTSLVSQLPVLSILRFDELVCSRQRVWHSKGMTLIVFETILQVSVFRVPDAARVAVEIHDQFTEAQDVQREPNPKSPSLNQLQSPNYSYIFLV